LAVPGRRKLRNKKAKVEDTQEVEPKSSQAATMAPSAHMAVQAHDADESWTITGEVVDENGALVVDFEAGAIWSSNGVY